jgi:hypothetical protein
MAGSPRLQRRSNQSKKPGRRLQNLPQRVAAELKVKGGSPGLMLACATGTHIKEATLTVSGK